MTTPTGHGDAGMHDETGRTGTDTGQSSVAGGLDENIAGALTYLLGFITGIIFLLIEEENDYVRFHAAQSTILFGGIFVISIALGILLPMFTFIPGLGWVIALLVGLLYLVVSLVVFILWLFMMYKAYSGDRLSLPLVGKMAENYV